MIWCVFWAELSKNRAPQERCIVGCGVIVLDLKRKVKRFEMCCSDSDFYCFLTSHLQSEEQELRLQYKYKNTQEQLEGKLGCSDFWSTARFYVTTYTAKVKQLFCFGFFFFFSCGKKTRIKFVLSAVDLSTKVEKFLLPAQKLSENGPMAVIGLQRKKTTWTG